MKRSIMLNPRPDITAEEAKFLQTTLFHLGYIKSTPGKWVLSMKGQQVFHLMKEYQEKGHVEDIDSRWLHKHGAQKFGEFLLSILSNGRRR